MSGLEGAIELPARATIADVAGLLERIIDALDRGTARSIDAGAVEAADTATYQLLAAFVAELERRGAAPDWQGVSEPFAAGARLLGLGAALALPAD